VLPEYRDPAAGRLDLASAGLSLVAVLAVVFGLKQVAQDGIGGLAATAIGVGLVVGVGFVRRQRTLADPMIDVRLFRSSAFNASLATNLLGIFIAVGYFCSSPNTCSWCWGCRRCRRGCGRCRRPAGSSSGPTWRPACCGTSVRPG
jgi:hypothetical protein